MEIKMKETTFCMGHLYQRGKSYSVDLDVVRTLGNSAEVSSFPEAVKPAVEDKQVEQAPIDKMIRKAPFKKSKR